MLKKTDSIARLHHQPSEKKESGFSALKNKLKNNLKSIRKEDQDDEADNKNDYSAFNKENIPSFIYGEDINKVVLSSQWK